MTELANPNISDDAWHKEALNLGGDAMLAARVCDTIFNEPGFIKPGGRDEVALPLNNIQLLLMQTGQFLGQARYDPHVMANYVEKFAHLQNLDSKAITGLDAEGARALKKDFLKVMLHVNWDAVDEAVKNPLDDRITKIMQSGGFKEFIPNIIERVVDINRYQQTQSLSQEFEKGKTPIGLAFK